MKKNNLQKGFVVLFTILISSIVLLMALGIMSISTKEVTLSIQSRDAAKAFFAADAGMECALYADRQNNAFVPGVPVSLSCNGTPVSVVTTPTFPYNYEFYVDLGQTNPYVGCARVGLIKPFSYSYTDSSGTLVNVTNATRIEALGYNTSFVSDNGDCGQSSNPNNPRRIERGYRATY